MASAISIRKRNDARSREAVAPFRHSWATTSWLHDCGVNWELWADAHSYLRRRLRREECIDDFAAKIGTAELRQV